MRYWDSSGLVALAFPEGSSGAANALAEEDDQMVTWWGTPVEVESAVRRATRGAELTPFSLRRGRAFLAAVEEHLAEVAPNDELRSVARRLVRVHDIRAADALQLAAALAWCAGDPTGHGFVSLDRRLRDAAELEGFTVLPAEAPVIG